MIIITEKFYLSMKEIELTKSTSNGIKRIPSLKDALGNRLVQLKFVFYSI